MVAVALGALAIGGIETWNALQTRHAVDEQQLRALPASSTLNRLQAALDAQRQAKRSYVATGDPAQLATYDTEQRKVDTLTQRLRSEVGDRQQEANDIRALTVAVEHWRTKVAEPQIAAVGSGHQADAELQQLSSATQSVFTEVQSALAALASDVEQRAVAADRNVAAGASETVQLAVAVVAVVLLLLVAGWLVLTRLVTVPLEHLSADVRQVAEGDLDHVVVAHGAPEIADLGDDTEAMRKRLRDEADELRQLRQALAQRSPLHGLLRSELQSSEQELDVAIAGRLIPADGVLAGDWYDAWDNARRGVVLALVDVSGHGPEAGMLALRLKHLLGPPFRMGMQPGTAVAWVVQQLGNLGEQCATGIVLDIDFTSGRCRYANAGHPSGLLFGHGGVVALDRTGPLVSALGGTWETHEITASPGDVLVLVTDGLIEARLPDGSEFGTDRLVDAVRRAGSGRAPQEIADQVIGAVRSATAAPLRDDATIVVARFDTVVSPGGEHPVAPTRRPAHA